MSILHRFRDIITYFSKCRGHRTLNTSLLGVIYHACTRTSISTRNVKCLASPITKIWLGVVCHRRLGFNTVYQLPACKIWRFQPRDLTTPHLRVKGLDTAYTHAIFDHSSFSRSGDMVVAHQNLYASRDLTTPLSETVCHPWASTCYDEHICQIWSL